MSAALFACAVNDIGITRIKHHVVDAGVLADIENLFPCFSAVSRFVQSAFTARTPYRSFRCDIYHIAVAGVNGYSAYLTRFLQTHVLPACACVIRAVYAVTPSQCTLMVVFAGTGPDHVVVARVNDDAANGICTVFVKNRFPGGAVVLALPDVARSNRGVDLRMV